MKGNYMNKASLILTLTIVTASAQVQAQDVSPGLWEITLETRVPGDDGWKPSPSSLTQCITNSQAKDPSKFINSIMVPGATDCNYTDKSYSGQTFNFSLSCSGTFGIKVKGSVTFNDTSFNGEFVATAKVTGDKETAFQNRITAKRLGGC